MTTTQDRPGAPTPAEIRAALAVAAHYSTAYAYELAQEQAADAAALPTVDAMVSDRLRAMTATPETRAQFLAYLDELEQTHGHEPAMAAYIRTTRTTLGAADSSSPSHLEVA